MKAFSIGLFAIAVCCGNLFAVEWAPAKGPLSTRWAKDVSPEKVLPEYPRPQMVRSDWQNLNGVWQLAAAARGEAPPVEKELSGRVLVPFPIESALSGYMKSAERVWYRRTFLWRPDWAGKHVLLHFGAVNWESTVWVNGKQFDTHRGGYDGFSLDITDALKPSSDQELIVGVWNPIDAGTQPRGKQVRKPGGIFYTASTGIWQTVWLEPVPAASIAGLKIVPDLDGRKVRVTVFGRGTGKDHRAVVSQPGQAPVATGPLGVPIELPAANAKAWSPEEPSLCDLRVELRDGDAVVDEVKSYFALRKIEIGKEAGINRLLLNGKAYFQVGPLDQGFWPDGLYTAPTDEALRYDIEMTKKLGFNMARKHVKVEPERWYYWCDKLGLIVWQDMPSGDKSVGPDKGEIKRSAESARQYEAELERMIDGRGNHPCIVMWVPFNEGWGQYDTPRITQWVKKHDPSRLVDCASGWNDMNVGDVHDIHVYPGPGSPPTEPGRAAVLGEFGGLGLGVDGHNWTNKTWGYEGTHDSADLTRRYERLMQRVWQLREKGLAAAVYTQTTDVETEANGLLTYDREIIKVDLDRVAAANKGDFSQVATFRVVVPSAKDEAIEWRYRFDKPGDDWFKPGFDDAGWNKGPAGFGTKGTPGAIVRTQWNSSDVWARRTFNLPDGKLAGPHLLVHHDDDAQIYLNGVQAAKLTRFTTDYEEIPIAAAAAATLKPGANTLAVHCHQIRGGQYIDVGLVDLVSRPSKGTGTQKPGPERKP